MIPKWLAIAFVSILSLLIIVVGVSQINTLVAQSRSATNKRTITITAEGKISASPDMAIISASIVSNDQSTAEAAQNSLDTQSIKLVSYLKTSGIADGDINTSDYNLSPQYSDQKDYIKITGYSVTETLTAKIHDLTKVGSIIGGLTQNGANQIQSVSYTFNDPDALREQAREKALASSKQKAEQLANAAGVKLGKFVTFSEDNGSSVVPIPMVSNAMSVAAVAPTAYKDVSTVPVGNQDFVEDISVTYELK
jgi:uncharacterized protein YggE